MAQFTSKDRQRIIDEYLAATGKNMFVASEFIDWLSTQEDHEAYPWFFAKDDAEAAREYRIGLARQMASGLRISAKVSETKTAAVSVSVREFPAMVSPMAGRKSGGGYQSFSTDDPAMVAELRGQGAQALRAWLARYRGVAEFCDIDLSSLDDVLSQLEIADENAA
ncbi:MAG: hypothetical protein ABJN39_09275 [Sulfitobacter sp.]|uniref:hypothetical protein n=1 Tax=Alphaproteobacteria TaxID=28211 RepID=UPI0029423F76|nr:hypothetical protein [Sulfitobacter sp. LC.270.F.C4]WOI13565.1 hypothetical protein R1T45_01675 [Sulfitobacter sp. LC.270.F.C4]